MTAKEYTERLEVEYLISNNSTYLLMEAYALHRIGLHLEDQSKAKSDELL